MPFLARKNKNRSPLFTSRPKRRFGNLKLFRKNTGQSSIRELKSPYLGPENSLSKKEMKIKRKPKLRNFQGAQKALNPPTRLRSNPLSKIKRILLFLMIIFLVFSSIYFFFFSGILEIKEFEIFEDEIMITDNLELNELVRQNSINQHLIFLNQELLIKKILDENQEFEKARIELRPPSQIQIFLEKYPSALNVYNEITTTDGPRIIRKYILNSNGMIIFENEENPDLPTLRITTNKAYSLGEFPLNKTTLKYIIQLINLFEEKFGIRVVQTVLLQKAREVHLLTEKNFTVWFDLSQEINPQIDKLKKALTKLDIYNTPLEYIDLRIRGIDSEKVIYKRR